MPESVDGRRKKLLFRSSRRGMREIDILLGGFAHRHLEGLDDRQLVRFETLLDQSDLDLFNWITGREPVPADLDHDVMELIIEFKKELHSS